MLELTLPAQCDVIYVPCLLVNPLTGEQCIIDAILDTGSQHSAISQEVSDTLQLNRGNEIHVEGSAGVADGWESECIVAMSENDKWCVQVDVLPLLPVHMVIGMDIISTGNLSLSYEKDNYVFRFEQLTTQ